MCGISGIILKSASRVREEDLATMNQAIVHRGPDDGGQVFHGGVGLGSRRLSIIDLSPAGHMPMERGDGSLWCVYNGEIYNHEELRRELIGLGHVFRSRADTEVILAAYQQWGRDCLSRFNGMWGFAIHDRAKGLVFCARDRFGVKPFHFLDREDRFVFGSEIRQLLPHLARLRARGELLGTFLLSGATDYSNETFFEGIDKLPAGHSLTYDLHSHSYRIERWYSPATLELGGRSEASLVEEFVSRFDRSIELRLRSDVRVGACLSGGLDSSLIAAMASARHHRSGAAERFRAVTAISTQPSFDESHYAEAVVNASGLEWVRTRPDHAMFIDFLDRVVVTQEEPFPTTSMIFQYFVMKAAREAGITVLLDGQGGDEILLGYPIYRGAYLNRIRRTRGLMAMWREMWSGRGSHDIRLLSLLKYMVGMQSASLRSRWYEKRHSYFRNPPATPRVLQRQADAAADITELQKLDVFCSVLPGLLRYEDRSSMAWSIETRLPFLDFNMVEFCLSLPVEMKIREGWSKYLLRRAASGRLPDSVVWRRSKFGFESPESDWLGPYLGTMRDAIQRCPILHEIADPDRLGQAYDRLDLRSRWRLFVVSRWSELFGVSGVAG